MDALRPSQLWVRVSVYISDVERLEAGASAEIGRLADRPGNPIATAAPVEVPISSGTANAATTDLYFAIEGHGGHVKTGQRVGVTLPLTESGESLTVPWAAVVTDINGGNWVYKNIAPQTYQRHRVQVRYVEGGDAAIATGPATGTKVGHRWRDGTLRNGVRHREITMLNSLVASSLRFRVLVLALAAVLIVVGCRRSRLRLSMFPGVRARRWSKSRPKRPAFPPKRSRASSPCRSRTPSTARPG